MEQSIKLLLPENQSEITVGQYMQFVALSKRKDELNDYQLNKRKIKLFTGLTMREVDLIALTDFDSILAQIDKALDEEAKFESKFEMGGIKYGFIPNLNNIKAKEWVDLTEYQGKVDELHKLMAILFRPITKEVKGNGYSIKNYTGTDEYAEVMRGMPLSIASGGLGFFLTLQNELQDYILKYMTPAIAQKESQPMSISTNMDG